VRIMQAPAMKERLNGQGMEVITGTPEQFGELIKSETVKCGKVIREKNIRID